MGLNDSLSEEQERIVCDKIRMLRNGKDRTPGQIAQSTGLSNWEVRKRLRKMGLGDDRRLKANKSLESLKIVMRDQSRTYAEIAKEFGLSQSTLSYHADTWGMRRRVSVPMDDSIIIQKYVNELKSLYRVGIETGYCRPRMRRRLVELGLLRSSGETHLMRGLKRARSQGSSNILGSNGYPIVPVDSETIVTGRKLVSSGRYAFLHILEAERKLGRPLEGKEIVHHIDFDRLNASPDNLLVCVDIREHAGIHGSLEKACSILYKKGVLGFNGNHYFVRTDVMTRLLDTPPPILDM